MRERKPIIDNPVYSEILIKINNEKVYSLDFIKKFTNKERSVLSRQLQVLSDEGYLNIETIKEIRNKQEIKFKGNLKYYSINWKKILLDFYKVLIIFTNEKFEEAKEIYKDGKYKILKQNFMKGYNKVKSDNFKKRLIKSLIFQDYIGFFLKELSENYECNIRLQNVTLRNIFLEVFEMGLYSSFEEFVDVINMIRPEQLVYTKEDVKEYLKKGNFDNEKIKKYSNEIKFIFDYYFIIEDIGMGSKFYDDVGSLVGDKLEKKYLKK